MEYRKCFVPICENYSLNIANKIFIRVRDVRDNNWCRELNVEYLKVCIMFCCDDHHVLCTIQSYLTFNIQVNCK